MRPYPSGIQEVGQCDHRSSITVSDTPTAITLTAGKNSIELIPSPTETEEIYIGGSGVSSSTGVPLGAGKVFANCKSTFSIYVVCETGKTANLRVVEYE